MGILSTITNRKLLAYLGGIATATVGVSILKSAPVRKATVNIVAGGMKLRDDAMTTIETIKEDAQDVYAEARSKAAGEPCCDHAEEA